MFTEAQSLAPDDVEAMGLVPPHSIEAEQSTLGALMLDNSKWDDICEIVDAGAFYYYPHRLPVEDFLSDDAAREDGASEGSPYSVCRRLRDHRQLEGVVGGTGQATGGTVPG